MNWPPTCVAAKLVHQPGLPNIHGLPGLLLAVLGLGRCWQGRRLTYHAYACLPRRDNAPICRPLAAPAALRLGRCAAKRRRSTASGPAGSAFSGSLENRRGPARRVREFDFRVLDDPGRLYWCGFRAWLPGSPHDPEFFSRRPRLCLTIGRDGEAEAESSSHGRSGGHCLSTRPHIPGELRAIGRAPFGD